MKKIARSFYANVYLNAAQKLGIDYELIDETFSLFYLKYKQQKIWLLSNKLGVNQPLSSRLARNKYISGKLIAAVTDIAPQQKLFRAKESPIAAIRDYVQQKDFRVVIKALDLSLGEGVYVLPKNKTEVERTVSELLEKYSQKFILVEDYFPVDHEYRVIILYGKIIDVLRRIPAFVSGDGSSTIQMLIEAKNKVRMQNEFKKIDLKTAEKFLEKYQQNLSYIPQKNEHVKLSSKCNLAAGGETERISLDKLHSDYFKIAKKIHEKFGLNMIGLDLMTNHIGEKPNAEIACINEVNSSPTIDVQYFADLKEGRPFYGAELILKEIFNV